MIWILLAMLAMPQEDSALVKAAKAAGGPRKPSGKVITNDDVKKNALPSAAAPPPSTAAAPATKTMSEKLEELRKARAAAQKRVDEAEKKVAGLEAQVRSLELAYYEESDLDRRDTVLVARFMGTKTQLDAARKEWNSAKDALKALGD
ncbi:MAG TPA: hypothetical protein VJZ76_09045 [Thermoanaerobaculia bacterium]|nr:hypothetical protein [Thermoanaerobaculia bacterium]